MDGSRTKAIVDLFSTDDGRISLGFIPRIPS
jgi:hypothetical protein